MFSNPFFQIFYYSMKFFSTSLSIFLHPLDYKLHESRAFEQYFSNSTHVP